MITRRNFIKALPVAIQLKPQITRASELEKIPILQTLTTNTTAQFIVLRKKTQYIVYEVYELLGQVSKNVEVKRCVELEDTDWIIEWLLVENLDIHQEYILRVANDLNLTVDQRTFKSLNIHMTNPKIMIASCMHDNRFLSQKIMWKRVAQSEPDIMFWAGDCVYADYKSQGQIKGILNRHIEVRRKLKVFYLDRLIPTLSIWDNHDFGIDSGGGVDFPHKSESQKIFWSFFGSDDFSLQERKQVFVKGPANASAFYAFNQLFFLMDDRTHRDNKEKNGEHWGVDQESWLHSILQNYNGVGWLINGSQFFGEYRKLSESFERDQPRKFSELLEKLRAYSCKVLFVSGDVHFSEIMRIEKELLGYNSYEFTSSSIHSFSFPGNNYLGQNRRRLKSANRMNFLNISLDSSEISKVKGYVECIGLFRKYFDLHFEVI